MFLVCSFPILIYSEASRSYYTFFFLIVKIGVQRNDIVTVSVVLKQFNMNMNLGQDFKYAGVSSVNSSHVAIFYRHFLIQSLCLLFLLLSSFPLGVCRPTGCFLDLLFIKLFKAFGFLTSLIENPPVIIPIFFSKYLF